MGKHKVSRKPNKDFPLAPASNDAWTKKTRGKVRYCGTWGKVIDGKMEVLPGDEWWKPASALYDALKNDLQVGREPSTPTV